MKEHIWDILSDPTYTYAAVGNLVRKSLLTTSWTSSTPTQVPQVLGMLRHVCGPVCGRSVSLDTIVRPSEHFRVRSL